MQETCEKEILQKVKIYAMEQNFRLGMIQKRKSITNIRELLEEATEKETLNRRRIEQIRKDFDIKDIQTKENLVEIQLGGKLDEDETGSSH